MAKRLRRDYPGMRHEQWLRFVDDAGPGCAQPDLFLVLPTHVLLLEVKLTHTEFAWPQMEGLYVPLLEYVFERPVTTVQVCKNLRGYVPPGMIEGLEGLMQGHKPGRWVWQNLAL